MPPDTHRRPAAPEPPATHASCTRITQPRVHGLDDDDIQLRNGTSRPKVSVQEHRGRRAITGRPATGATGTHPAPLVLLYRHMSLVGAYSDELVQAHTVVSAYHSAAFSPIMIDAALVLPLTSWRDLRP